MNRSILLLFAVLLLVAPPRLTAGAQPPHNFAQWEKEIAAFEAADRTNPPPKNGVLFIGSSTIRLWKTLAQDFPSQPVIGRGVGGCEIVDCTHFADRIVFPYQPRMIFFRCGGNDLANGKSPEQVFADYQEFVAAVRTRLPEADIVFISWSPTVARWSLVDKERSLNKRVETYSRESPHLQYIDTYDLPLGPDGKPRKELFIQDGLHFNAEGYKLLTARVRPFLLK